MVPTTIGGLHVVRICTCHPCCTETGNHYNLYLCACRWYHESCAPCRSLCKDCVVGPVVVPADRQRQRNIFTDKQTDRQTDIQLYRETGKQEDSDKQTDRQTYRHTYTQTDIHTHRQTDRQRNRQGRRETDRYTDIQAAIQTLTYGDIDT